MMKEEEITALAREYAEEMIKGKRSEELPNCLKNSMLAMNTEYVAEIFRWLTRRFCLVEKEAVRKEYREATAHVEDAIKSKNPLSESCGKGKRLVLKSLFPEIAKEVEG